MQDIGHTSPRVGTSQLASFVNKRVLFVGRVETQTQGIAQMVGPDGGRVTVQLQAPMEAQIVEVEGTVVDGQTIREDSHVHFNDNFDLNLYNEMLKLTNGAHVDMFRDRAY